MRRFLFSEKMKKIKNKFVLFLFFIYFAGVEIINFFILISFQKLAGKH